MAGQRLANTSALDQLKFARGLALIPSIGLVTGNALHVADISRAALARSLAKIVLQIDAFFGDARAIALKNLKVQGRGVISLLRVVCLYEIMMLLVPQPTKATATKCLLLTQPIKSD